ncbi:hypothetical protein RIF29_30816 [Crotalaria pallida]|uniref:VQ domain-containing protein n=1 Tax=Crotalaria pallida TaxID=3830 RepID=A0AAN9EGY4_CROPI
MESGGCSRKPVKIVIINTQYVETDAMSFKSVVQKLTGKKHSSSSSDYDVATAAATKANKRVRHSVVGGVHQVPCAIGGGAHGSSFLLKDFSFNEFDVLLGQMPLINDDLWSD